MSSITFKFDTTVGFHFDFKAGETMLYTEGNYNDGFMEWTFNIYQEINESLVFLGDIRSSSLRHLTEQGDE
jgi:hypothetical protein